MGPLIRARTQARDAQDDQFGVAPRQLATGHESPGEMEPSPEQAAGAPEGREDGRWLRAHRTPGEPAEHPGAEPDLPNAAGADAGHGSSCRRARSTCGSARLAP